MLREFEQLSYEEIAPLPPASITYALEDPARTIKIGLDKGIRILTPDEAREVLPHYPGFGVPLQKRPDYPRKPSHVFCRMLTSETKKGMKLKLQNVTRGLLLLAAGVGTAASVPFQIFA